MISPLTEVLNPFSAHIQQERRLSSHTVAAYQRDLTACINHMAQHDLDQWTAVRAKHIRQWIAQLNKEGLSGRSIQRHLSALRSLFRYLIREGLAEDNPAQSVQAPKTEKRLPATLDVDQVSGLLDPIKSTGFIPCRDRAIMELLYSSGLRLAELANLDYRDIDFADRMVYVTGKGNKQRRVPIGEKAIAAIQNWLQQREQAGIVTQAALFTTKQGRRLGVRAIQQRLKHWGQRQGISDKVHPHRLRHAFASHMLESSGDLRAVQELLGHADIATTQIYTHVDFQHLAKVYDSAHPRAKK